MDKKQVFDLIKSHIPDIKIYLDHSLSPYTTIKSGGPADIFINVENQHQLISLLKLVYQKKLKPLTFIGNGSNLLISDDGIRGIVIKNSFQKITLLKAKPSSIKVSQKTSVLRKENDPIRYLNLSSLDYDENDKKQRLIKLSSGTKLPFAINKTLDMGLTGLQWFAYIPANIGGAVCDNIHGGNHNLSEYIYKIKVFNFDTGLIENISANDLDWKYDHSFFQQHKNLYIISVTLKLFLGDSKNAKKVVADTILQKQKVQDMKSCGSVFKNPCLIDCQRLWNEQKSTGWIIDMGLGLKEYSIGGMSISPLHANFIVNNGNGKSIEYLNLVKHVQNKCKEKFGLELETEVEFLGF